MSKITNDGLTRSGTGCTRSSTNMATVGVKGFWLFVLCIHMIDAYYHIFMMIVLRLYKSAHERSLVGTSQGLYLSCFTGSEFL